MPEECAVELKATALWSFNLVTTDSQGSIDNPLVSQKDFSSQKKWFNLFTDKKGIWCCGGWLSNVEAPFATKHPVLLPWNHPLSKLVREAHECVHHNGVKETLTETRRKFWIPKERGLVRYLIYHCTLCRRFGSPLQESATTTSTYLPCEGRPSLLVHWCELRWTTDHSYRPRNQFTEGVDLSNYMLGYTGSTIRCRDRHVYSLILEMLEEVRFLKRPTP